MASAQDWERRGRDFRMPPAEPVTVSGNLVVTHGFPAIISGDVTYIVGGITRLAGLIDELRVGAELTIEGMAIANPRNREVKYLRPITMTLNEETFDLARPFSPRDSARFQNWSHEQRRPGPGPHAPHRHHRHQRPLL